MLFIDALRTIVVWITMASIFPITNHVYGEGVSVFSILQGAGFIFMMLGTITHNNIAGFGDSVIRKICCCFAEPAINNEPLLKDK